MIRTLLAWRRPRDAQQEPVYVAATILGAPGDIQYETSREAFLGRTNTLQNADGLSRPLSGKVGIVIDPYSA